MAEEVTLGPGNAITFRTRLGADVVVRVVAPGKARSLRGECEACGEQSRVAALMLARGWAEEHAETCTAIPVGYVDCRQAAIDYAEQAAAILAELEDAAPEQQQRMLAEADIRARNAATYAELARHQAVAHPAADPPIS